MASIALAASCAGIFNDYAHDDAQIILQNPRVHDLGNIGALFTVSYWPPPAAPELYRPLTTALLAIEYAAGGGSPAFLRLISYLLYACAAVAVLMLARALLPHVVAFGIASLFAAHPIHSEAVALAVGQSELVVGLLAIAMVVLYIARRRAGELSLRDWTAFVAMYGIACLFKEQGFVLPGLLLCAETCLTLAPSMAWKRRASGYLALAATAVMIMALRRSVLGELAGAIPATALLGLSPWERTLTMLGVVPEWTRLLLWPAHLQVDYSPQEIVAAHRWGALQTLGAALLLATGIAAVRWRRSAPVFAFGVAWCAVALLPVSNVLVPTGVVLAERTLFLPSIGAMVAVGGLCAFYPFTRPLADGLTTRRLATACALLVILGVARSASRQRDWRDEWLLSVRSVQDAPRSYRTQQAYGNTLFEINQPAMAKAAYAEAIALAPKQEEWRVRNNFADGLRIVGETAAEAEQLRASLAQNAFQPFALALLVAADLKLGRYPEAMVLADTAIVRGGSRKTFTALRAIADSAQRIGAAPGSVSVDVALPQP